MYSLEELGWDSSFQQQIRDTDAGLIPTRVAEEQRGAYVLMAQHGVLSATVTGRLIHDATGREDFPAVGDWVLAEPLRNGQAVIRTLLERRSKISRKTAGKVTDEQVIAANVDVAFLVTSLNQEMNVRRIERYLAVIWESGAVPVIVLNKADLAAEQDLIVAEVADRAPGVPVVCTSALESTGIGELERYVGSGHTAVMVGSSGVGKSSLVNRLMGEEAQSVHGIRSDDKGRHTTTSRQLMVLPSGGLVIDTPGLRELQLWDAGEGIDMAFSDIANLAERCAFSDCRHQDEPGCAVAAAIADGELTADRLESHRKLEREQRFIDGKKDHSIRNAERNKWKQIHKANRQRMKLRGR